MNIRQFFIKKILPIQLILIVVLVMIFNILLGSNKVEATTYTQYTKTGISEFPESYQSYLKTLSELHPNWTFTAYYTGMTWTDFLAGETSTHGRNTVISSSDASWLCSCGSTKSGYTCASEAIIAYYADPRNFLTESGIFQFLEMSYNSSVHTLSGVKSILSGTFMDKSITVSKSSTTTSNIAAKQDGSHIYVTPDTKLSTVASTLGVNSYKVTNTNSKSVSTSSVAATGYTFTNSTYNTSYTIIVLGDVNGDREIKATDYMKIKNYIMGTTTLTNTQKLAADVNGDGEIKATDYMKIKNHIMGSSTISVTGTTTSATSEMTYAEIIMDAAEESGISPYSIAIKILQEVGNSGSNSVSGTYSGYEGYYNFFNWGAYDSGNAITNALAYAKEKGWDDQYTAIVEGAKLMADSYVGVGQNTAYFYKFDVVDDSGTSTFWHQYMTNVQDPSDQAKRLYNTYTKNSILDISLNFIIPVFDNMPSVVSLPSAIDSSASTYYYINASGVNFRSSPTTSSSSLGTFSLNEVVTVVDYSYAEANDYTWAKVTRANGATGYVANKYLTKCN